MADVTIHLLTEADAEDILRFELENRAFFAATLSDRGDDYMCTLRRSLRQARPRKKAARHQPRPPLFLTRYRRRPAVARSPTSV